MEILKMIGISYLVIINLIAFAAMGIDKSRARRGAWRISEATFFGIALIGGSIGCIAGMRHFRHKTKHWHFKCGMPAILLLQIVVCILLLQNFL